MYFWRTRRARIRVDRYTHETKAEVRFSNLKQDGAVEVGACEQGG